MAAPVPLRTTTVRANDLDFGLRTERLLAPSSRMVVIDHAGHFLQLEQPAEVNDRILAWVTG